MATKNEREKAYQKEYQKRWRAANPDYKKQWSKDHPLTPEQRERNLAHQKAWKKANADKVREYTKKYNKKLLPALRKRRREFINDVKVRHGCQNPSCCCPKELPPYCLDFHHIGKKSFNLGNCLTQSMSKIKKEMEKCTVLCVVCHRMETHGELDASCFTRCTFRE